MIDLMYLQQLYKRREIVEIKWINRDSNPINTIIKLRPYQALKDLININMVKLQVTKQVERTGDKEGSISDLINQDIGRTSGTLPSYDRNLWQFTIICHSLPALGNQGRKRQEAHLVKN